MAAPAYSVVIPTAGRSGLLEGVLRSLAAQSHRPHAVVVVDAEPGGAASELCRHFAPTLPLQHRAARVRSAAQQRNQGAEDVRTPAIVFCDDDMSFRPDTLAQLLATLETGPDAPAGVAARIEGLAHPPPGPLLRRYYRWQAGYEHPTYGGKLFGPAINCWPCYACEPGPLVAADWLNSALVAYRTDVFLAEKFPAFAGYSYMEDAHLSARIARRHRLAFHCLATCTHHGESTARSLPRPELVAMQWRNRALIARDILGVPPARLRRQLRAHRAFVALHLIRARPAGWREELSALLRQPPLLP